MKKKELKELLDKAITRVEELENHVFPFRNNIIPSCTTSISGFTELKKELIENLSPEKRNSLKQAVLSYDSELQLRIIDKLLFTSSLYSYSLGQRELGIIFLALETLEKEIKK